MTIRFVCSCGKRLKAPNSFAGRRKKCPSCDKLVEIPRRGLARLLGRPAANPPRSTGPPGVSVFVRSLPVPLDPDAPDPVMLRRPPRWIRLLPKQSDPRWYDQLTLPVFRIPAFVRLAALLTLITAATLAGWLAIPRFTYWQIPAFGIAILMFLALLGSSLTYFNATIVLASRGKVKHEPELNGDPLLGLVSCGQWLACFLAGPALLFLAALIYWVNCGELTVVDWLILAEIGIIGVGWWSMGVLITNAVEGTRVAWPRQVIQTAVGMGTKTIQLTLLASVVFLGHAFLVGYSISRLNAEPFLSLFRLSLCWTSGLYLTAFTCRRMGMTYYQVFRKPLKKRAKSKPPNLQVVRPPDADEKPRRRAE